MLNKKHFILDFLIKTEHCHAEVADTALAKNGASGARDSVSLLRVVYPQVWELVLSRALEHRRCDNPFATPMCVS